VQQRLNKADTSWSARIDKLRLQAAEMLANGQTTAKSNNERVLKKTMDNLDKEREANLDLNRELRALKAKRVLWAAAANAIRTATIADGT